MDRRATTALAVPFLLLVLTACTPGVGGAGAGASDDPSTDPSDDPAASGDLGPVLTDCVDGDWHADVNDLAAQLGATLASNGLNVVSSTASGTQDVSIDGEGYLGFGSNVTFVITVDMGDGMVMTLTQTHTGSTGADWAWNGDAPADDTSGQMVFTNFTNSGYTVHNTVAINGVVSDQQFPMPEEAAGEVPLAVTCDDDTLTTKPDVSPFTTTWHR
jgi:hypothetical protein